MHRVSNIVILTGAGISVESGLPAFRTVKGQTCWDTGASVHPLEDVATPEAFARDPVLVHQFYDARRARLAEVEPNAAHLALARLDSEWPGELLIVTQNVDDLHERAGAKRLLHMHGELMRGWCLGCSERFEWEGPMNPNTGRPERSRETLAEGVSTTLDTNGINICPACETPGHVRPDIVWFGEMPYEMERIEAALMGCDLFVSIGTSGAVYPAAGFVQTAKYRGARTLEINLEPSQSSIFFDERRLGLASEEVPTWVEGLLQSAQSSPMSS